MSRASGHRAKTWLAALVLFTVGSGAAFLPAHAEDPAQPREEDEAFPPRPFAAGRYTIFAQRSPFMLASQPEGSGGSPAKLSLGGLVGSGNDLLVILVERDSGRRVRLRQGEEREGLKLIDVDLDPDPRKVSATVQQSGVTLKVEYPDDLLNKIPASRAANNPALLGEGASP